jgi:H+/Cl- antiporter ClcA
MSRTFERSISTLVLVAVILAGMAAVSVLGTQSYFGATNASLIGWRDWFSIPVAAVLGGVVGGIFSRLVVWASRSLPSVFGGVAARRPIAFAALCGLAVAGLGIATGGATYGTGYEAASAALAGHLAHPALFAPAKFFSTLISFMSGIPGGIFSPSLSIGAGLGAAAAKLIPGSVPGAVAVLTMVGFFSGVVQAPITGFVIVSEMTGDQAMIVPLMATALIASAVSKMIAPEPIYHALATDFARRMTAAGPPESPAGQSDPAR